ncbi:hypothetical protein MNBD_GAMMA21-3066 [hydrothermal vent metagenome]|uniref:AbiEi antitoxin C-terminal domain-containing protein n=1 Tax=hydrothermal vent metagenome TaxID=652676 RepID=A0A3B0ZJD9_9ZZZZ
MLSLLNRQEFVIFTTREYAQVAGISLSSASRTLARYTKEETLTHLTKGIWANTTHPYFTPLACVPYLLGKEQGYVSFLTALHLHSVLAQIPKSFHIAITGHTRKLDTEVGRFEFIKLKPELMREGIDWSETRLPYLMASVEKTLLDVIYISTRKHNRFGQLPELDLVPGLFNRKIFQKLFKTLDVPIRIKRAMEKQIDKIL